MSAATERVHIVTTTIGRTQLTAASQHDADRLYDLLRREPNTYMGLVWAGGVLFFTYDGSLSDAELAAHLLEKL